MQCSAVLDTLPHSTVLIHHAAISVKTPVLGNVSKERHLQQLGTSPLSIVHRCCVSTSASRCRLR